MKARLTVERGRTDKREITLRSFPVSVGRMRDNRLQVTSRHVSRHHCVLDEDDGRLIVRDLGSSNGTLVNGETIETLALADGDVLEIGPVVFRVALTADQAADEPSSDILDDDDFEAATLADIDGPKSNT